MDGLHHELVNRYGVSICAMKTDLFDVSQFSSPLLSTPDLTTFYQQLGGCFQRRLPYRCTWCMLSVFTGVLVAHLLMLLCIYDFSYFMFFVVYVCFPCLFHSIWTVLKSDISYYSNCTFKKIFDILYFNCSRIRNVNMYKKKNIDQCN